MDKINTLFIQLRDFLKDKSEYSPVLVQRPDTDTYPKVVFMWELGNNRYNGNMTRYIIESYTITLDIYAKDTDSNNSIEIAEELQKLIYEFFVIRNGINISFSSPTPNVDESIYRITMRFNFGGGEL